MRSSLVAAALVGALPLAGCTSETVQTASISPVQMGAPVPNLAPGPERDREWMKLAPQAPVDPKIARSEVDYQTKEKPGTIIVSTVDRRLYYVLPQGRAMSYPVSVGKEGMSWTGTAQVDRKMEWPDWNPPKEMFARKPDLPTRLEGGPLNPIGARSLFLAQGKKDTLYRIHGTNEPESIGQPVSSGCIRMLNEDVIDLYNRVPIGSKVVVI